MPISNYRSAVIANIAYANVAGMFALFHNDKMRGPEFSWRDFLSLCEDEAETWAFINLPKCRDEDIELMKKYSTEISQTLLKRAGYSS